MYAESGEVGLALYSMPTQKWDETLFIRDGQNTGYANYMKREKKVIEKREYATHLGMTLRDYFAAKALQSQIVFEGIEGCDKEQVCGMAYEIADQMLIERKREYERNKQ